MWRVWAEERCIQSLGGKPEEKIPIGISGHRFEGNVKGDLKEIRWEGVDWIVLGQGREQVVGCCESGSEPPVPIKCGNFF